MGKCVIECHIKPHIRDELKYANDSKIGEQ